MKKAGKYQYPVTPETLHRYARSIFEPIKRGESITTIWVPMAGRRMWTKFVIENIGLFKKEFPDSDKYLLIYVEPLDLTEESRSGYLRLMGQFFIDTCRRNKKCSPLIDKEEKIFKKESAGYASLLEGLRLMLRKTIRGNQEVIFFLGEFDELSFADKIFYNNLKSLWSLLYPKLHFIFLVRENITNLFWFKKFGELNEAVLENVVFVPLLTRKDVNYLISLNEKRLKTAFSKKEKKLMERICGNHPYLLKTACRLLSQYQGRFKKEQELEEFFKRSYVLKSAIAVIYEVLNKEEKEFLVEVANQRISKIPPERVSLKKLGLVRETKTKVLIFSQLLNDYILSRDKLKKIISPSGLGEGSSQQLVAEEETGAILFNNKPVEERFSHQEYEILLLLIKSRRRICSRDDIGKVLWGEDFYERYSDWAIDQLMSKLRKKLKELGLKNGLKTLRGRGYKLVFT